MNEAIVQVPNGWIVADDPPDGLALVALAPESDAPVRANLVVTISDRADLELPDDDEIDGYLDGVVGQLLAGLDGAELLEAWTTDALDAPVPTRGQRYVVRYTAGAVGVLLVQQHTWVDDALVVVSVTAAEDTPADEVDVLVRCLDPAPVAA